MKPFCCFCADIFALKFQVHNYVKTYFCHYFCAHNQMVMPKNLYARQAILEKLAIVRRKLPYINMHGS